MEQQIMMELKPRPLQLCIVHVDDFFSTTIQELSEGREMAGICSLIRGPSPLVCGERSPVQNEYFQEFQDEFTQHADQQERRDRFSAN